MQKWKRRKFKTVTSSKINEILFWMPWKIYCKLPSIVVCCIKFKFAASFTYISFFCTSYFSCWISIILKIATFQDGILFSDTFFFLSLYQSMQHSATVFFVRFELYCTTNIPSFFMLQQRFFFFQLFEFIQIYDFLSAIYSSLSLIH